MQDAPPEARDDGERLAAQGERLRLLLLHLAGRVVRARVDTEDLLQEIYLRAITAPTGLPPVAPGEAELWRFLVVIARHTVIDAARSLRAAKRAGEPLSLDASRARGAPSGAGRLASAILDRSHGPRTRAAAAESARALEAAFAALAPDQRRVIGLRRFEGLSAREAAERMGRTETAVHSLFRRALEAWEGNLRSRGILDESGAARRSDSP